MFKDLKQYNMKINRFPYFFVWVFLCKLCCSWCFDSLLSIIKVLVVKFLSLGILLQWKFRQFSLKVGIDFYNLQGNQIEEKIEKIPNAPGYVASYPYNSNIDELQTNERICLKRAETIETNMKKNPSDMKKLNEVVQDLLTREPSAIWVSDIQIWVRIHHASLNYFV